MGILSTIGNVFRRKANTPSPSAKKPASKPVSPAPIPEWRFAYFRGQWVDVKTGTVYNQFTMPGVGVTSPGGMMPKPEYQTRGDDMVRYASDWHYDPENLGGVEYPYKQEAWPAFRLDQWAYDQFQAHTLTAALFGEKSISPDSYAFEVLDYANMTGMDQSVPFGAKMVKTASGKMVPCGRPLKIAEMLPYVPAAHQEQFRGDFLNADLRGHTLSLRVWLWKNREKLAAKTP